jgi:hypothetical protein
MVGDPVGRFKDSIVSGEQIVRLDSGIEVGGVEQDGRPRMVQRNDDGQGARQVGGDVDQMASFTQRVLHQMQLAGIQLREGLLQVTHTAVDQLRAAAAGTCGERQQGNEARNNNASREKSMSRNPFLKSKQRLRRKIAGGKLLCGPDAKSSRSTKATLRPRLTASSATPVPVALDESETKKKSKDDQEK